MFLECLLFLSLLSQAFVLLSFFPLEFSFFSTFFGSSLSAMAVKRNREALLTRSALVIACVPETSLGKPVGQLRCHTG